MPEPITLKCAAAPDDTLVITTIPRHDRVEFDTLVNRRGDRAHATQFQLDAHTARQVFRWLGVWLHEQGEL